MFKFPVKIDIYKKGVIVKKKNSGKIYRKSDFLFGG